MLNRACRLLNPSSESSTVTPSAKAATARLSQQERESRWKSLVLKISLMFHCLWIQTKTALLLGQPVYNALFNAKQYQISTPPPTKLRFLKGQVVGKQLTRGTGAVDAMKAHVNPGMCRHPDEAMKQRGNKQDKWWLCEKCLCRWERLEASEVTTTSGQVDHLDLMTFGKHTGDTFQTVAANDPNYCMWAQRTVEEEPQSSPGLQRFVQYLQEVERAQTYEADDSHEFVEVPPQYLAAPNPDDMDL